LPEVAQSYIVVNGYISVWWCWRRIGSSTDHVLSAVCVTRYRHFAPHSVACGKAAARICKTTPCTVEVPRARARGAIIARLTHCGGCAFLVSASHAKSARCLYVERTLRRKRARLIERSPLSAKHTLPLGVSI
jgi:hypothetical protein